MQMKKTQRSYSSFRAKTQQAQIVDEGDNSWMTSNQGQRVLKHLNHKISTSQLINPNEGLYNSVSERVLTQNHYNSCIDGNMENGSEYGFERKSLASHTESNLSKSERVIAHLREKCRNYEKALQFFHRESQDKENRMIGSNTKEDNQKVTFSNFNYSEQYYVKQIDELRRLLLQKQSEIQKYKKMATIKPKEQLCEKNLYIKEINAKNCELNKLNEKLELFTKELETKEFVIKEKQSQVSTLLKELEGIGSKKIRLESYEQKITQNEQKLKEIQSYTLGLKEDIQKKDALCRNKSQELEKMIANMEQYEQKLKMIEGSLIQEMQKNQRLISSAEQMKEHHEKLKLEVVKLSPLKQLVRQKQEEISTLLSKLQRVKQSSTQILQENQNLKQQLQQKQSLLKISRQQEQQLHIMRKQIKQKDESIAQLKQVQLEYEKLSHSCEEVQNCNLRLQSANADFSKTISQLQSTIVALNSQLAELNRQAEDASIEKERLKDRNANLDIIYNQNKKLNAIVHQKINEIEKNQLRIQTLENKLSNLTNENSKLKTIKEELSNELLGINQQLQGTQRQLQGTQRQLEAINQQLQVTHHQLQRTHEELQNCREKLHHTEQQIGQLSRQHQHLLQQLNTLSQQNNHLNQQLSNAVQQNDKLTHQCTSYKATIAQIEEQNIHLEKKIQQTQLTHQQDIKQLQHELHSYKQEKQRAQAIITDMNQRIVTLNQHIIQMKHNLQDLVQKEHSHAEMIKQLESQLAQLQNQNVKLTQENLKLTNSIQSIFNTAQIHIKGN